MSESLLDSVDAAIDYLLARQAGDGHFEDYRLPVGRSDQWITAVAGGALARAAERRARDDAAQAARRAAAWLTTTRTYPAGWGFNGTTGADADATAWTLHLLAALGITPDANDVRWLLAHHRDGGFATYDRDDGWGVAHPDVTPVAFLALPAPAREAIAPAVARFSRASCVDDRWWPAYWWRNCHYSTYWNLRLARALGWDGVVAPPLVTDAPPHAICSSFDLVHLLGIASVGCREPALALELHRHLRAHQRSDGAWPGSDDLCVTDSRHTEPWRARIDDDRTARYVDVDAVWTTATVVSVLCDCAG